MTRGDRPEDDRHAPPVVRFDEPSADDDRAVRVSTHAQPWRSQGRLMRKPGAESLRARQRRRGSGPGDAAPPPTGPLKMLAPRRIGGSLLLAVGYSLAVWAALFLIANALADVI